jgi:EAL domain-containing protein (putative c-di-GMP-specific phosphodiesterase class I)
VIPPGKFVPIAEEIGLIIPIGYWVLGEACRQLRAWQEGNPFGLTLTMNVNLSGKQLQRPDVVERVREVLHVAGVDPGCIRLEITESVMMTDLETTIDRLRGLKRLGVKLAMDDFGTGYSSMAHLAAFPLDSIKIDRAFVQRLALGEAGSAPIVEAIIALSKAMRLEVTGEGVETQEQLAQLRRMGCDIAQGFLFARPLQPDALRAFVVAGPQTPVEGAGASHLPGHGSPRPVLAARTLTIEVAPPGGRS